MILRSAAREHSRDMGARNYFEHVSKDGRLPIDRMHAVGWSGRTGGENIFGGQKNGAPLSAAEVVAGWMEMHEHHEPALHHARDALRENTRFLAGRDRGLRE